jgi:hypothetical protein
LLANSSSIKTKDRLNFINPAQPVTLYIAPNPHNTSPIINFNLLNSGFVDLEIRNLLGQKLHTLVDKEFFYS